MVRSDAPVARAGTLALIGGELALDFANTSSGRGSDKHIEHLLQPRDVAIWAAHAKVLTPKDARWLEHELPQRPGLAGELFDCALRLREDIYHVGAALAAGLPTPRDRVAELSALHTRALARAELAAFDANFGWRWVARESPVEAILGPISLSALTLLQQADLTRVKQCDGESCGWLFFDATKNKKRRWCEMGVCGNRAKQRRFAANAKDCL